MNQSDTIEQLIERRARERGIKLAPMLAGIYGLLGLVFLFAQPLEPGMPYAYAAFIAACGMLSAAWLLIVVEDSWVHASFLYGALCMIGFCIAFLAISRNQDHTAILIINILAISSAVMAFWISPVIILGAVVGWLWVFPDFGAIGLTHWFAYILIASFLCVIITWRRCALLKNIFTQTCIAEREKKRVIGQRSVLKRLVKKLSRAKNAATQASKAKSDFMANISHELRTPMNSILGFIGLLLKSDLTDEQKKHLSTIRLSADNLMAVINEILDFSEIEKEKLDFEAVDFNLRVLMKEVTDIIGFRAKQKGLNFFFTINEDVPDLLTGDPSRLRQVMMNIADNAVKFTLNGSISIKVSLKAAHAGNAMINIKIRDTGVGIPNEIMETIFEPFTQADPSPIRNFGGTGLGLTVARRIIERLNGTIDVESIGGQGSTFWITLPLKIKSQHSLPEVKSYKPTLEVETEPSMKPGGQKVRVLVVEDNDINQDMITLVLGKLGFHTDVAADGVEAIVALETLPYDLVLMDVQMPNMDGIKATQIIRSPDSKALNPKIPIVALTAHALKGDREKCMAAGMDDYLTKPVDPSVLVEKIKKFTSN